MEDKPFTSITGSAQTSEPSETSTTVTKDRPASTSKSSSIPTTKRLQPKIRSSSAANSPVPSREGSPVRTDLKSSTTTSTTRSSGPARSRKNSVNDVSPSRSSSNNSNPPSAAAQQRALSAATTPRLYPTTSDPSIKAPVPQKLSVTSELKDTPRWPISPRLRSPPPVNKPSITSPRKPEHDTPLINVHNSTPLEQEAKQTKTDSEGEENLSITGMRTPGRGVSGASSTLETVQEISQPNTPSHGLGIDGALEGGVYKASRPLGEVENPIDSTFGQIIKSKQNNESGSESGGKSEIKMKPHPAPPVASSTRPSGTATKSYGPNTTSGSTKNMTVETETVSSIPQVAVGGVGQGNNGSIRAKPSSETIRPKKEKKKTARKTPSVASGTGEQSCPSRPRLHHHHPSRVDINDVFFSKSPENQYSQGLYSSNETSGTTSPERPSSQASQSSRAPSLNLYNVGTLLTRVRPASSKADIFEAKVASAVDEANSSDSEETFVYESNPPDANDRPRRFHSRTPSATSMASQVDQRKGSRSMIDGVHSVAMKKSMKFANSYNTNNNSEATTGDDDGTGTGRSHMGTGRGTAHHHHIGRWGRNGGNGHASLFDTESPFPNAAKSKLAGSNSPRYTSHPTSPRAARSSGNGRKSPMVAYDMDDGADDERTPLVSSIRSGRSSRARRPAASSMRQLEHQASRHDRSFLSRFAGCLLLLFMIGAVILISLGFMHATTQPLTDVRILALKNVLASEQDLIFEMKVQGRNPNIVSVTIDSGDLVLFAKSKYAGTDSEYWRRPSDMLRRAKRRRDDDSSDPPLDGSDPGTNPNLEIGHVHELDTSLSFDGSPFQHSVSTSTGQLRIVHPGNHTTPAGSERWGKVIQHEFDLIVRGTLKYTLPLSQRLRSVSVEGRVTVKPNAADQEPDDAGHIV